jgi:hypothetical protein
MLGEIKKAKKRPSKQTQTETSALVGNILLQLIMGLMMCPYQFPADGKF